MVNNYKVISLSIFEFTGSAKPVGDLGKTLRYIATILEDSGSETVDRATLAFPKTVKFDLFGILAKVDAELNKRTCRYQKWDDPSTFPLASVRDILQGVVRDFLNDWAAKSSVWTGLKNRYDFCSAKVREAFKNTTVEALEAALLQKEISDLIKTWIQPS
jgi:hypothetical protein